jgi:hypothetical protein
LIGWSDIEKYKPKKLIIFIKDHLSDIEKELPNIHQLIINDNKIRYEELQLKKLGLFFNEAIPLFPKEFVSKMSKNVKCVRN